MSTSTHTAADRAAWLDAAARAALIAHLQRTDAGAAQREAVAGLDVNTVLLRLPPASRSILAADSLLRFGSVAHRALEPQQATSWRRARTRAGAPRVDRKALASGEREADWT